MFVAQRREEGCEQEKEGQAERSNPKSGTTKHAHNLQLLALVQTVQANDPICRGTNVLLLGSAAHYCVLSPFSSLILLTYA